MTTYDFDWDQIVEDVLQTREFTFPTVGAILFGFSQKWMASCLKEQGFSCVARGYSLPDIVLLLTLALVIGVISWGVVTALRVGYNCLMEEYLIEREAGSDGS